MNKMIEVLHKDGTYYAKLSEYQTEFLVNGDIWIACPGNPQWVMGADEITSIQSVKNGNRPLIKYKIREKYDGIVDLPEELPPTATPYDRDACECDPCVDDECRFDPGFYDSVWGEPEKVITDLEFTIIDKDCVPCVIPKYVTVDFPNNLKNHPETWGKYPCTISATSMFNMVVDALASIVNSSKNLTCKDYKNIGHYVVYEYFMVNFDHKIRESYYKRFNSKNLSHRIVQETKRKVPVVDLCKADQDYGDRTERIIPPEIKGDNLDDVLAKKDAYVKFLVDRVTKEQREVCPHCKGHGAISIKKEDNNA